MYQPQVLSLPQHSMSLCQQSLFLFYHNCRLCYFITQLTYVTLILLQLYVTPLTFINLNYVHHCYFYVLNLPWPTSCFPQHVHLVHSLYSLRITLMIAPTPSLPSQYTTYRHPFQDHPHQPTLMASTHTTPLFSPAYSSDNSGDGPAPHRKLFKQDSSPPRYVTMSS